VVECLDKAPITGGPTPWLRLSDSLVERSCIPENERQGLRADEEYYEPLEYIRARLLNDLAAAGMARQMHPDFLTALLALQRRDGNANGAAMKYFLGDPLGEQDLRWLCSPQGLAGTGDPHLLLNWVLRATRAFSGPHEGAFVICIDQIEDLYDRHLQHQLRFPEMVSLVRSLAENHPGLVVVLACLQDYYTAMRGSLVRTDIDRIELNPRPVLLRTARTAEEICALVARRLRMMDAPVSTLPEGGEPTFPFLRDEVIRLQGLRSRAVLNACHEAWHNSRLAGDTPALVVPPLDPPQRQVADKDRSAAPATTVGTVWPQRWNDFRTAWDKSVPSTQVELAELLSAGVNALAAQTRMPLRAHAAGPLLHLSVNGELAVAAICNAAPQGGRLLSQLQELRSAATALGKRPVILRSTEFPKGPRTQVGTLLAEISKAGGSRVSFPEADWRAIMAWRAFAERYGLEAGFHVWVGEERPLSEVGGLRDLVRWEDLVENIIDAPIPSALPTRRRQPRFRRRQDPRH
jgi:hypothetical protein